MGRKHTEATKRKLSEASKRAVAEGRLDAALAAGRTSKLQSRRRKDQIAHEKAQQDKLREAGYEVYPPTVVCDCIAIKDGEVFFVEFKKPGQQLRAGQQRVRDCIPGNYLIVYAETAVSSSSRAHD